VAHQVGALNKAGLAALTLIEELDQLPPEVLFAAYDRASQWLAESQCQDLSLRLNEAARLVFLLLRSALNVEDAIETLFNRPISLQEEILKLERSLIRQALAKANGSVTRAASLLSMSYQGLAYTIEARHKDLLKERSPVRRRSRKDLRSN
ncbi:MAG: helix-turn-helix domain-containing protein, partial [Pyrinomonadaceae bacterium]